MRFNVQTGEKTSDSSSQYEFFGRPSQSADGQVWVMPKTYQYGAANNVLITASKTGQDINDATGVSGIVSDKHSGNHAAIVKGDGSKAWVICYNKVTAVTDFFVSTLITSDYTVASSLPPIDNHLTCYTPSCNKIIACSATSFNLSVDDAATWVTRAMPADGTFKSVSISEDGTVIWVVSANHVAWKSTDDGVSWTAYDLTAEVDYFGAHTLRDGSFLATAKSFTSNEVHLMHFSAEAVYQSGLDNAFESDSTYPLNKPFVSEDTNSYAVAYPNLTIGMLSYGSLLSGRRLPLALGYKISVGAKT